MIQAMQPQIQAENGLVVLKMPLSMLRSLIFAAQVGNDSDEFKAADREKLNRTLDVIIDVTCGPVGEDFSPEQLRAMGYNPDL